MNRHFRGAYATDAGMHCLWCPTAFRMIDDYEAWEKELLADSAIRRRIKAAQFVPINIGSDGSFEIELRVGTAKTPEALSDREAKYLVVESKPYRFASDGKMCVSGIEYVHCDPTDAVGVLVLPKGEYAVTMHMIGWDEEPGMADKRGLPKKNALPDFVVLVNPQSEGNTRYRTDIETFPPPPE